MTASVAPSPALLYAVQALPILIAPFAPHIAEELWERLGHERSVHLERYLELDETRLVASRKSRSSFRSTARSAPVYAAIAGVSEDEAVALALAEPNVRAHLGGKELRRRIYVPDKVLNLVAA